jgi:cell division protein FtsL
MATGNAELNYQRRKADIYPAPSRRSSSRPAYKPYEPPARKEKRAEIKKNEDDFYPVVPLKTLTPAEIRAFCVVIVIITGVAMGIVFLAEQATMVQKEINDLKRGIAQVDDDIANLKIEIEQSKNMQLIKIRAQEELNMKEPSFDQYVYLSDLPEPQSDFGKYIKERAYGGARSQAAEPKEEQ